MKKRFIIATLILILLFSGCTNTNQEKTNNNVPILQGKTNYIAPIALSKSEQELMYLVAPNPNEYILCEFDASNYKKLSIQIDKYKYGELVDSIETGGMVDDTSLGKGKLYMEFHDDKFDLTITRGGAKASFSPQVEIDAGEEKGIILYTTFDNEISLNDNDKILFYKAYAEENTTSMNGYNTTDLMQDDKINEYPLCIVVKLVVE